MTYCLRHIAGHAAGEELMIPPGETVTAGRTDDNYVVLADKQVSRRHFEIVANGNRVLLRDLGSANGTRVNGRPVTEVVLGEGDVIAAGPFQLEFTAQAGTDPGMPVPDEPTNTGAAPPLRAPGPAPRAPAPRAAAPRPAPRPGEVRSAMRPEAMEVATTGSFQAALESQLTRFNRLPPNTRRNIFIVGFGVMGLILAALAYTVLWGGETQTILDYSDSPFELNDENYGTSFGYGNVDIQCRDKAQFTFKYGGGRAVLHFTIAGTESPTEVVIFLNSKKLAPAPMSSGWKANNKIPLPMDSLLKSEENTIVFDNTENPPGKSRWGVGQVRVAEVALPQPNLGRARELFDLGRKRYDERRVGPENLYRAWEYFRQSRDFMELTAVKPDLDREATDAEDKAAKELGELFNNLMFTVHAAVNANDATKARAALRQIMQHFPEPEDSRYVEAKEYLEQLAEPETDDGE